jgi:hypothetical protein
LTIASIAAISTSVQLRIIAWTNTTANLADSQESLETQEGKREACA